MDAWNCLPLNYALLEGDSARTSARHAIALPTVSGFFYFALIGLLLLGAVNFQSNIGFLLAFALLTIGFVGLVFVGVNFHGVTLATDGDIYCESGKDPVVRIQLQSKNEHQQIQIASDIDATTCDVSSSVEHVSLCLPARPRGVYPLSELEVGSLFPFGWVMLRCRWRIGKYLIVYPAIKNTSVAPVGGRDIGSHELTIRPYRTGDRISSIAWKKTKTLESPVVIDFKGDHKSSAISYRDYANLPYEEVLSVMTRQVFQSFQEGRAWSLELPQQSMTTSRGQQHLQASLKALALA